MNKLDQLWEGGLSPSVKERFEAIERALANEGAVPPLDQSDQSDQNLVEVE
jgi:hypothetical protein